MTFVVVVPLLFSVLAIAIIIAKEGRATDSIVDCFPEDPHSCNGNGQCIVDRNNSTAKCVCNERYAGDRCASERRVQSFAFLLSFFLGFLGVGRFYLGYILIGCLKLFAGLCSPVVVGGFFCFSAYFVCAKVLPNKEPNKCDLFLGLVGVLLAGTSGIAMLAWWITDWSLIAAGQFLSFISH